MFVIRPIRKKDFKAYSEMAFEASPGITSLPKNQKLLKERIHNSEVAFSSKEEIPEKATYLFVLENTKTGEIGGTCGIYSKTGCDGPSYFYRIEDIYSKSDKLPFPKRMRILHPTSYLTGPTEICGIFLKPSFRKEGLGKLLSLSRFFFIGCYPHRFDDKIISEMRGFISVSGQCPFWNGVGRNFLNIDFKELVQLLEKERDFIPEVLPEYPIYVNLLSTQVQHMVGKVHQHTRPALSLLLNQGFDLSNEVDVFDGGPKLIGNTHQLQVIRKSVCAPVAKITKEPIKGPQYLIAKCSLDFRACISPAAIGPDHAVTLMDDTAEALHLKEGDMVRFIHFKEEKERIHE